MGEQNISEFMSDPAEIIRTISQRTKLPQEEINRKINEKIAEFGGLLSEIGAAYCVGKELGVEFDIRTADSTMIKVSDLKADMRNVEIKGSVTDIYPIRNFSTAKAEGKVGRFMIKDETGMAAVVLWNRDAEIIESGRLKMGDNVRVTGARVKEGLNHLPEVHAGDKTRILFEEEEKVDEESKQKSARKLITGLDCGKSTEIRGMITDVSDLKHMKLCRKCKKKMAEKEGRFRCLNCGGVEADPMTVLNLEVSDLSGTLPVVLFRSEAEKLVGEQVNEGNVYQLFEGCKEKLLGEEVVLSGAMKENKFRGEDEFVVNNVVSKGIDPVKELAIVKGWENGG